MSSSLAPSEISATLSTQFSIPLSFHSSIDDSKLVALVNSTRTAVRTNAAVLDKLCHSFGHLSKQVQEAEGRTQQRVDEVVARVAKAVERAEGALNETARLAKTCVRQEEFESRNQMLERRLQRLERATGEILPPLREEEDDDDDEVLQQQGNSSSSSSSNLGALGKFVVNKIEEETEQPLAQLYSKVTDEWDAAFQALSNETISEISAVQSQQRIDQKDFARQLEGAHRTALEHALEAQTASLCQLKAVAVTLAAQQEHALSEFGFTVRREVAAQLHHTRRQGDVLHKAVGRLRNTLCLPADDQLEQSQRAPSHTAATDFLSPQHSLNHSTHLSSSSFGPAAAAAVSAPAPAPASSVSPQQHNAVGSARRDDDVDFPSWASSPSSQQQQTQYYRAEKQKKPQRQPEEELEQKRSAAAAAAADEEEGSSLLDDNGRDDDDPIYQSLLMPRGAIATTNINNNSPSSKKQQQQQQQQLVERNASELSTGGGSPLMTSLDRRPSIAADFFRTASDGLTGVDVENILSTPIFSALRDLLLETAKNEIDAQNTMRENQRDAEIEGMRQQLLKKVGIDIVHKLIERSKDRQALEKLETVMKNVQELQNTVIREKEWRTILLSKADFSTVDAVRVQTAARCASLEEDVQRLERAVVVGFGESLNVAPAGTFEKLEAARMEEEAERENLRLERAVEDDPDVFVSEKKQMQKLQPTPPPSPGGAEDKQQHLPRGTVDDARAVVVANPRQFLHSAPPSRPTVDSSSVAAASTGSASQPRVASAGRSGSRYFSLERQQQQNKPQQQQNRGLSPAFSEDEDTSIIFSAFVPKRSSGSNSASSVASSSFKTQVAGQNQKRPPRHSLIYTGFGGAPASSSSSQRPSSAPKPVVGGAISASSPRGNNNNNNASAQQQQSSRQQQQQRPGTAGAVVHSTSSTNDFSNALRTRCGLSESDVKHW